MFETDKKVEKEGIVLDYGEFKITVARSGTQNQRYNKLLETLTKQHRRAIQTETIDPKTINKILMEVFAKTVVLSWENVKGRDNKTIEFNYKNCIKLFSDLPELFEDIKEQSAKMGLFRKEVLEENIKN